MQFATVRVNIVPLPVRPNRIQVGSFLVVSLLFVVMCAGSTENITFLLNIYVLNSFFFFGYEMLLKQLVQIIPCRLNCSFHYGALKRTNFGEIRAVLGYYAALSPWTS
jgi:hypothetical protein